MASLYNEYSLNLSEKGKIKVNLSLTTPQRHSGYFKEMKHLLNLAEIESP
jgi:hypothetical protein